MGGSIDTLGVAFHEQTALWFTNLQPVAFWFLVTLWTITLAWKFALIVLQGGKVEFGDLLIELVRRVMLFGLVLYVIQNADWLASLLLESAMALANEAAGRPPVVSAGAMLDRGVGIGQDIMARSGLSLIVFSSFAAFFIVACFAAISAFCLVCLAEFYITAGIGSVFLGFAGSPWTSEIAKRYVMQVGGAAAKLLGLYLIIGFADQMLDAWVLVPAGPGEEPANLTFGQVLRLFGIVLVVAFLTFQIPAIMHGLIGGASIGAMGPMAMMQASMQATTALAGAALRGGAAVQAAGSLTAAQAGASSLREAVGAAGGGARGAATVAGGVAKNLGAGLLGTAKAKALGASSTAGTLNAMREALVQGVATGTPGAGVEATSAPGGGGKSYLGQRGD